MGCFPGYVNAQGYMMLYRPHWHNCDSSGCVRLHRYKYELLYGVKLPPLDVIHHVNGIKLDNMKNNFARMSKECHDSIYDNIAHRKRRREARKIFMSTTLTYREIGKLVGVGKATVGIYVSDLIGIKRHHRDNECILLHRRGLKYVEIGEKMGISIGTISCILSEYYNGLSQRRCKLSAEVVENIRVRTDLSQPELAFLLSVNQSTISKIRSNQRRSNNCG